MKFCDFLIPAVSAKEAHNTLPIANRGIGVLLYTSSCSIVVEDICVYSYFQQRSDTLSDTISDHG
jgi:hypothetical protein